MPRADVFIASGGLLLFRGTTRRRRKFLRENFPTPRKPGKNQELALFGSVNASGRLALRHHQDSVFDSGGNFSCFEENSSKDHSMLDYFTGDQYQQSFKNFQHSILLYIGILERSCLP